MRGAPEEERPAHHLRAGQGRRPLLEGVCEQGVAAVHLENSGMNCIKIGLPGKSILGDYFQENMTSRSPFLLLTICFPRKTYFYTIASRPDWRWTTRRPNCSYASIASPFCIRRSRSRRTSTSGPSPRLSSRPWPAVTRPKKRRVHTENFGYSADCHGIR